MSHVFIDHFYSWNEALKHEKNLVPFFKVISFSFDIGRGKNWLICLVLLADNIKLVRCWQIFDKVQYKRHIFIIKNKWSYSGISSLIHPFYLFFFFFTGRNQCNQNFFRRCKKTTARRKWQKYTGSHSRTRIICNKIRQNSSHSEGKRSYCARIVWWVLCSVWWVSFILLLFFFFTV